MAQLNFGNKVGLLFSGGPAPCANSVISAVSMSFLKEGKEVIGFKNGYKYLENYSGMDSFIENEHYIKIDESIRNVRNERGIYIGTARANPGKAIKTMDDFNDAEKTAKLKTVLKCFKDMEIGLLVTMGGDDTLKVSNYLNLLGMPVIHVPKTIDNDYVGIPWTFGYWTAVDVAKNALLNLRADAKATDRYYVVELMGRSAGWITYGAGIAGEADIMLAVEDFEEEMDYKKLLNDLSGLIIEREKKGLKYGVICVAEGLAGKLPDEYRPKGRDEHGNLLLTGVDIGKLLTKDLKATYEEKAGCEKRILAKQIGYEIRNASPISYDTVLASMLGYGAYKLSKEGKYGHMVSVEANLDVYGISFKELIDPDTLRTKLRPVPKSGDFFKLKEILA